MPKFPLLVTDEDELAAVPAEGPWTVEVIHRLFHYAPFPKEHAFDPGGFAFARNGETVELVNRDDYVRGLRFGAFVDPSRSIEPTFGEGAGDFAARPDLVEFVKEHKVDDILDEAHGDADMAQLLIDAENEAKPHNGEPRKGVIHGLQAIIDTYLDEGTPPGGPDAATAPDGTATGDGGPIPDPGDENEDGGDGEKTSEEE